MPTATHEPDSGPDGYDLDGFTRSYMETALWSSTDGSTPDGGEPLDENYTTDDIPVEESAKMRATCADFVTANADDLAAIDPGEAGCDFWLTRNGHGAGFWDRGLGGVGGVGDRLTEAAHVYGEAHVGVDDDGTLYVDGELDAPGYLEEVERQHAEIAALDGPSGP